MPSYFEQHRFRVAFAFALVYLFWGSTYLAIDLAIAHIPAALMAGLRFSIAGPLMLAYCALAGRGIAINGRQFVQLVLTGALMLSVSNVILCWAENYIPTGLAALLAAIVPIWFLLVEQAVGRRDERPSMRGYLGVALGIAGVAILLWPDLRATGAITRMNFIASVSLLGASFSWALGSVLSRRWQSNLDAFSASGWQMTFAGVVNVLMGLALGDQHHADWSWKGLAAVLYLVVFGSWVGYSAYVWLLKHVPTAKVATYAYVNPIVALFLGWLVLHERIDIYIALGTAVIVPAVALVTGAKLKKTEPEPGEAPELPEVEAGAD